MKFYDRQDEIAELRRIRELSRISSHFTVITGRRRVGKTELLREAFSDEPFLYFYVSRKALPDLCEDFRQVTQRVLGRTIPGSITSFSQIFRFLMEESANRPFTLVIDEFQDFLNIDEAIFSEISRDWDELNRKAKINLVVCGSIHRLMSRIFEDRETPLYGRNTGRITVEPFKTNVLKEILSEYNANFTNDDLLALWTLSGGVARYVALLMDSGAFTRKAMLGEAVRENSPFFDEGKVVLAEEFGKEHGTYFSILSAIASGKTARDQIETVTGGAVGGYLTKLEREYGFVSKKQPIFENNERKNCLYAIDDNFYRFWFRFIFKYNYLVEVKMFDELRGIVERDYDVFSGRALEGYFRSKFIENRRYSRIGGWWDRKGENEIDLVCENEFSDVIDFYEVKRDRKRIDLNLLREKTEAFFKKNPHLRSRKLSFAGLCVEDM